MLCANTSLVLRKRIYSTLLLLPLRELPWSSYRFQSEESSSRCSVLDHFPSFDGEEFRIFTAISVWTVTHVMATAALGNPTCRASV